MQIVPAILATTEQEYKEKLEKIQASHSFEDGWVQIDLMDNKFVQNKSVGIEIIGKYKTELKKEVQLMVQYPENFIDELIKVGASRIIFPVEDSSGVTERIKHIRNHNIEVGLSINPETDESVLEPYVGIIDVVLVMSVKPGFSGQEFIPETFSKIKKIKDKWGVKVGVDGGVNEKVIRGILEAGADYVVMGSHLLEGDIDANIEVIWERVNAG